MGAGCPRPPGGVAAGLGGFVGDADAVAEGELAAEEPGHPEQGQAPDGQRERARRDRSWVVVAAVAPGEPGRVAGDHDEVQGHVHQRGAERRGPGRDAEQVEEPGAGGGERADYPHHDQPQRPLGQEPGAGGDVRGDVEHQARRPGADRHGDQDRVEGMAVRPGQRAHRPLGLPQQIGDTRIGELRH
jgi:hypothetical protein